jgi:membrane-associated phospholipid phosphatase
MSMDLRWARARGAVTTLGDRVRSELRLGRWGTVALGAAVACLVAAAMVFALMLEDVLGHDGIALRDSGLDQAIADHRTPGLIAAAKTLTNVGSIGVLAGAAVVVLAVLWFRGLKLAEAVAPFVSLGVAAACAAALKVLVGRVRPDLPLRLLNETEPSFPSGHATDSTALFVSLAIVLAVVVLRRPLARVLVIAAGFAVPALIGLTRLELGVHWPSDVIAGWALGTMAAVAVASTLILLGRLADTPGPDRTGLRWRGVRLLGAHRSERSAPPVASASMRPVLSRP